ncbi:hypothetical protein [Iodidimonas muriae]|nr:hypothetical protein [Iodidimonas muriae]
MTMQSRTEQKTDLPKTVHKFLSITDQLTALLAKENHYLETRRPRESRALVGEKLRLTQDYREALGQLRVEEASALGEKGSDIRKQVAKKTEIFRSELARHAKLIIRLKSISEGVVKAISAEAMKQKNPVQHYGNNGRMTDNRGLTASLTLDCNI